MIKSKTVVGAALLAATLVAPAVWAQTRSGRPAARSLIVRPGSQSFLGVGVAEVDSDRAKALGLKEEVGVEVKSVEPDSPAAKSGLKEADVVLEYNGQRVEGVEQFIRLVRETPVGRQSKILVSRGGAQHTLTATIGSRENAMPGGFEISLPRMPEIRIPDTPRTYTSWRSPALGIESESLGTQLAEYFGVKDGALVRAVVKGTAAEKAGLKAGDVIVKVDDKRISGPREIPGVLRSLGSKRTFPLTIVRERKEMTLNVTLDDESMLRDGPRGSALRMEDLDL